MSYDIFKNIEVKKIKEDLYFLKLSFKTSNFISKKNNIYAVEFNKKELIKYLNETKDEFKTDAFKDIGNKGLNKINKILNQI